MRSTKELPVRRVNGRISAPLSDVLSVEEPLEIRIGYGPRTARMQKSIAVTMRTPGNDPELAVGFLFTEGIISSGRDVSGVFHANVECPSQRNNIIRVELTEDCTPRLAQADRNFYTTSSCGVCGKSSIQSIRTVHSIHHPEKPRFLLDTTVLYSLPAKLTEAQNGFAATGGIHASGLFTLEGDLVLLREDVGRHNALDKLIGSALLHDRDSLHDRGSLHDRQPRHEQRPPRDTLPLHQHILLLSGRTSFELIQKAAMADISVVAAIGAPSSLAVELAEEFDITLLGFLKEDRFNIYHSSDRISISVTHEN